MLRMTLALSARVYGLLTRSRAFMPILLSNWDNAKSLPLAETMSLSLKLSVGTNDAEISALFEESRDTE